MGNEDKKKKLEGSNILESNVDKWHNIKDIRPGAGQHVAIRLVNKHWIYKEDDEKIYYVEDEKQGVFVKDYEHPDDPTKGRWVIDPPHPKYDYGPISREDKLLEGTVVTHWREITDEEIFEYQRRLSLSTAYMGDYEKLRLEVDKKHEEVVYRAIIHAAAALSKRAIEENDRTMLTLHAILYDLASCIDSDEYIEDGTVKKLYELKDPEIEDTGVEEEKNNNLDPFTIIRDTLQYTQLLAETYMAGDEHQSRLQAKLMYEFIKGTGVTTEECEALISIIEKIGGIIKGVSIDSPVDLTNFEVRPENMEIAMKKIAKFQDEMLYRIIDEEARNMIKLFNSEMDKLGVPLHAELDEDHNRIDIRPNEKFSSALKMVVIDNEYKSGHARLSLIRYPKFVINLIDKGLLNENDYDHDLYVSSKKYYDDIDKQTGMNENVSGIVQDVLENCGKEALKSAKHIKVAEELKEKMGDVEDDNGSE